MPIDRISLDKLIDTRNESLYCDITKTRGITIDLVRDYENGSEHWSMTYDPQWKKAIFYAGVDINDINAFTHEMLHVIQEEEGQESFLVLPVHILMLPSPSKHLFNKTFILQINNVILHYRMIPEYLNLGFSIEKFIYDYDKLPSLEEFINTELLEGNKIKRNVLGNLLTLRICYRFHPNEEIKMQCQNMINDIYFDSHHELLKRVDNVCRDWEEGKTKKNINCFESLLNELDLWKADNQLI